MPTNVELRSMYDIEKKEWRMLTKYPKSQASSSFFRDGRLALVSASSFQVDSASHDKIWVLFGGCLENQDSNEFLVLRQSHLLDDSNFCIVTEIM